MIINEKQNKNNKICPKNGEPFTKMQNPLKPIKSLDRLKTDVSLSQISFTMITTPFVKPEIPAMGSRLFGSFTGKAAVTPCLCGKQTSGQVCGQYSC